MAEWQRFRRISFIFPALNEEEAIGAVLREIPRETLWEQAGLETEIVVVDSDSHDATAQIAQELGARVVNEPHRGYGMANLAGFRAATGDILVKADADGTYPLNSIVEFIRPILCGDADFVIGNRFRGHMEPGAMPLTNMMGNMVLSLAANVLFRVGVWDTQCGLRALTRQTFEKLELHESGMGFGPELVAEAVQKGYRIKEFPIGYRMRKGGVPKTSLMDGVKDLMFMVRRFLGHR